MSAPEIVIGSISETLNSGEFEWRISNCSVKLFEVETGKYLNSPTFSFSSCSWFISIYPNGFLSSDKDWISLFLHKKESQSTKYVSYSFDMTLQGIQLQSIKLEQFFKINEEQGWGRFKYILKKKVLDAWSKETKNCSQLTIKVRLREPVFHDEDSLLKVKTKGKEILCQNFKEMLLGHDVVFKVKDKEFKAHGIILQVRCPVFKTMLSSEMLEKNRGVVEIADCDPVAFEQFLFYIYTGELGLLDKNTMLDLYFIADKYDMKNLKEECCAFIKKSLSVHVVCNVIKLAFNHNDCALLEYATKYFIENAKEIFATEAWQSFTEENPVQAKELTIKAFDKDSHCCVHRSSDGAAELENKNLKILLQNYKDVLLSGKNHDLTLKVKDKEFKAHQDIMQCRCPVFSCMLTHEMLEKNSGVVDIPDCDPIAFEQFLLYIYTGDLETHDESIMLGLYYIADKYNMADLKEKCCQFIQKSLSVHNIGDIVRLAVNHNDSSLLEYATQYFVSNVKEILVTVEWQSFIKANPIQANELFVKTINNCPIYIPGEMC